MDGDVLKDGSAGSALKFSGDVPVSSGDGHGGGAVRDASADTPGSRSGRSGPDIAVVPKVTASASVLVPASLGDLKSSGRHGGHDIGASGTTSNGPGSTSKLMRHDGRPSSSTSDRAMSARWSLRRSSMFQITEGDGERSWSDIPGASASANSDHYELEITPAVTSSLPVKPPSPLRSTDSTSATVPPMLAHALVAGLSRSTSSSQLKPPVLHHAGHHRIQATGTDDGFAPRRLSPGRQLEGDTRLPTNEATGSAAGSEDVSTQSTRRTSSMKARRTSLRRF